jgi:hypothetical protein
MTRSSQKLRIIVAGMVAQYPVGGVAWDYLQYAIGLARLGHDVVYHEDTWCWPYDPLQRSMTDEASYSAVTRRSCRTAGITTICTTPAMA